MDLTKEEIIEGNLKIAALMNWKLEPTFPDKERVYKSPKGRIELDTTFKFHTSFDEIIPVVREINKLPGGTFILIDDTCSVIELWKMVINNLKWVI